MQRLFRKSIKVLPRVPLSLSKSVIIISMGFRGINPTLEKIETHLNFGIPGLKFIGENFFIHNFNLLNLLTNLNF